MDERKPKDRRPKAKNQRGRFDEYPLVCGFFKSGRPCRTGAKCLFAHKIPIASDCRTGLDNPKMVEFLARNVYMGAVDPPIDQTLKTLYLHRLNSSVHEQHIRDIFSRYGEIESLVYFAMRGIDSAFLTYTTREAAEKAMKEHSSWVLINGQNVKLLWGAHVIPKEAVIQKYLTSPKDSRNPKPLRFYTRKRQRNDSAGGGGSNWAKEKTVLGSSVGSSWWGMPGDASGGKKNDSGGGSSCVKQDGGSTRGQQDGGGEGPSWFKEGDGVSKQLGETSAGGGWETNTGDDDVKTSGEADNALGGKPNAGASRHQVAREEPETKLRMVIKRLKLTCK